MHACMHAITRTLGGHAHVNDEQVVTKAKEETQNPVESNSHEDSNFVRPVSSSRSTSTRCLYEYGHIKSPCKISHLPIRGKIFVSNSYIE